ncbi:arylsulfatase [Sphingobacterium suaedae]|uniref:Arylsulfatase n=1 Tax=Sphingobacterium suaedae TaxID=1686402 RepID=A0ABW5KJ39_9SPHI
MKTIIWKDMGTRFFTKSRFLLLLMLGVEVSVFAQQKHPNIIYIYADDMGYGELGVYGQTQIKTPHLDNMAEEGIRFTQHYSSAPVCAPSRAMLLTGRHAGHAYIRGNYEMGGFQDSTEGGQMPLPEGIMTIPNMLKNKGYKTAIVGKWGLGMSFTTGDPQKQGFDYAYGFLDQKQAHNYYPTHLWENGQWVTLDNPYVFVHQSIKPEDARDEAFEQFHGNDYAPAKMTQKALQFITDNTTHSFFLYLPYTIPHVGLQVPKTYVDRYVGQFPQEEPYYGENGYNPSRYPLSTYAAMITYLDDQVGILLARLKELGLDKNTLVLFSSDNGATFNGGVQPEFFNSAGGLRGLKMDVFEGGIRVPLIARWPGHIQPGTVSDHISVQYDMMATFAELTGQKDIDSDGISLLPTLLGHKDEQELHRYLYFEYPEKGGQIAIRMGPWKAIKLNVRKKGYAHSPWQLYNLEDDRAERNDVAHRHPELLRQFDRIVQKEHQQAPIREWEFVDPKF